MEQTEFNDLVRYEVPILRHITKHYELLGYSHNSAEQKAVLYFSEELRNAFFNGVPSDIELELVEQELQSERILRGFRSG